MNISGRIDYTNYAIMIFNISIVVSLKQGYLRANNVPFYEASFHNGATDFLSLRELRDAYKKQRNHCVAM